MSPVSGWKVMSLSATGSSYYYHAHYHFVGYSGLYLQNYPENNNMKRRLLSLTDRVGRQTSSDSRAQIVLTLKGGWSLSFSVIGVWAVVSRFLVSCSRIK